MQKVWFYIILHLYVWRPPIVWTFKHLIDRENLHEVNESYKKAIFAVAYIRLTCKKLEFLRLRYETNWSNNFCQPARSRTQNQVVDHYKRDNKPYVRRTLNSKLILSFMNSCDWISWVFFAKYNIWV